MHSSGLCSSQSNPCIVVVVVRAAQQPRGEVGRRRQGSGFSHASHFSSSRQLESGQPHDYDEDGDDDDDDDDGGGGDDDDDMTTIVMFVNDCEDDGLQS